MTGMILHSGGKEVALQDVLNVPTPEPTKTHVPIPHDWFLEQVRAALEHVGIEAEGWSYALNHGGAQMFALARIKGDLVEGRDAGVVCARNAHDKVFKASLAYGKSVLVCDNLAFSGEVTVGRKHTPGILDELPDLLYQAAGHITGMGDLMEARYDAYQDVWITDQNADTAFAELARRRIVPDLRTLQSAMFEFENPRHDEFAKHDVWGWFNACTEAFKGAGLPNPGRTMRLHKLADELAGVDYDNVDITVR